MGLSHEYKLDLFTTADTSLQTVLRATIADIVIVGIDGDKVSYEHIASGQMEHDPGKEKTLHL